MLVHPQVAVHCDQSSLSGKLKLFWICLSVFRDIIAPCCTILHFKIKDKGADTVTWSELGPLVTISYRMESLATKVLVC